MMITKSPFLILWLMSGVTTALRRRHLEECGALLDYDYAIGNGQNLTSQKTDGNFNIAQDGSVRCDMLCDGGDAELYISFGSSGGPADADNNDASDTNAGCNKELMATNTDGESGFRYTVVASEYVNMKIECYCYTQADPPTRAEALGTTGTGGSCFSASSTAVVQDKGSVAMKDLQVGDSVLVGQDHYEPVYAFGHKDATEQGHFLQIYSSGAKVPLEMTFEHLVFVEDKPVRADQVRMGDTLMTTSGAASKVTKIITTQKQGLYMPLTASGTIVVNTIVASTYVSIQDHAPKVSNHPLLPVREYQLLHAWLSPLRIICQVKVCGSTGGIHGWLLLGKAVVDWANDQSLPVQVGIAFPILLLLGLVNAMEWIGASFLVGIAALVAMVLCRGQPKQKVV